MLLDIEVKDYSVVSMPLQQTANLKRSFSKSVHRFQSTLLQMHLDSSIDMDAVNIDMPSAYSIEASPVVMAVSPKEILHLEDSIHHSKDTSNHRIFNESIPSVSSQEQTTNVHEPKHMLSKSSSSYSIGHSANLKEKHSSSSAVVNSSSYYLENLYSEKSNYVTNSGKWNEGTESIVNKIPVLNSVKSLPTLNRSGNEANGNSRNYQKKGLTSRRSMTAIEELYSQTSQKRFTRHASKAKILRQSAISISENDEDKLTSSYGYVRSDIPNNIEKKRDTETDSKGLNSKYNTSGKQMYSEEIGRDSKNFGHRERPPSMEGEGNISQNIFENKQTVYFENEDEKASQRNLGDKHRTHSDTKEEDANKEKNNRDNFRQLPVGLDKIGRKDSIVVKQRSHSVQEENNGSKKFLKYGNSAHSMQTKDSGSKQNFGKHDIQETYSSNNESKTSLKHQKSFSSVNLGKNDQERITLTLTEQEEHNKMMEDVNENIGKHGIIAIKDQSEFRNQQRKQWDDIHKEGYEINLVKSVEVFGTPNKVGGSSAAAMSNQKETTSDSPDDTDQSRDLSVTADGSENDENEFEVAHKKTI